MGDSIEEVCCNVAVKLIGNNTVHKLIESIFICNVEVKSGVFYYSLGLQFKIKIQFLGLNLVPH